MRRWILGLIACVILGFASLLPGDGAAQSLSGITSKASPPAETDIQSIMRTAAENGVSVVVIDSDGRVLTQVGDSGTAETTPATSTSSLMSMQDDAVAFRKALVNRFVNLPDAFNEVIFILRKTSPDGTIFAYVKILIYSLILLGIGLVFQDKVYGRYIAKGYVVARITEKPQGYVEKVPFLMFRFFMGVIGILLSMAVAYGLGIAIFGPLDQPALQFTVALIYSGYFMVRFVISIWRMILSPFLTQYRIPRLSDLDAKRLYNWMTVGTVMGLSTILFGVWIQELGLNFEVYVFLYSLLSIVVMMQSIALVLVNKRAVTDAILNNAPAHATTWVLRTLSRLWAPISILYFLFAWGQQTYHLIVGDLDGVPLLVGGWVILTTILVVYGVLNFFIERNFSRTRYGARSSMPLEAVNQGPLDDTQVVQQRGLTSFQGLAQRIAGFIAFVAGAYAFVALWNPDRVVISNGLADRALDVIVIIFLGYISYNAFRIWIDKKILEEQGELDAAELGDEAGGTSASRLATLLPLFRNFVLIVITITGFLITLMELGVNVGPLFAGAGIIGVAVGFGSQSLVRDIFSGAFFLFDDAFRRGEYIDIGGVKGTVEKISVRSFQLRHHLGALHTMPFGEIQVMTNYSRDWVIMKLPLRVTYDTDVEKVRKLIKNLGVALLDDPVIGDNFIQPLKSQGVIEMQDSAMIIRVKFMTKPGDQWLVRKKVYEDIRELFEREGIHFAHREVTVRLADGQSTENMSPDDKQAIAAAAHAAIEEGLLEGGAEAGDDR